MLLAAAFSAASFARRSSRDLSHARMIHQTSGHQCRHGGLQLKDSDDQVLRPRLPLLRKLPHRYIVSLWEARTSPTINGEEPFVLAASQEGESDHEGYYKRLHRLLGEEPTNRPPPNFYEMWALWDDLEEWANDDNGGQMGIVSCDFAYTWPHVGLPRAQIVLTDRERSNLPALFTAAELEPTAPPAADEMAQLSRRHGAGRLEARTIRRLAREGTVDEDLRSLTIEALLDELRPWDGTTETTDGTVADPPRSFLLLLAVSFFRLAYLATSGATAFAVGNTNDLSVTFSVTAGRAGGMIGERRKKYATGTG